MPKIVLTASVNPEFKPIVLTGAAEGELAVVAEFLEVLSAIGD